MPNLVGTGLNQVPTNGMLGGMAYQSPDHASIKSLDLKNLSQINSEIGDNAVDVLVYDTSKDSDGGAWRKRTQSTSWYNETLNTSTRGARKEFPAVAVIVATASGVIIYDGDDPDLPMWMIFEDTASDMINTHNVSPSSFSLSAKNGSVLVGSRHPSYGEANVINFISDSGVSYYSAHSGDYKGNISQRNDGLAQNINSNYGTLVNSVVNDVAMTVLPNAPIDPSTGLPIPTIAVATQQGISIITDSGTVYDLTPESNAGYSAIKNFMQVAFTKENHIVLTDKQVAYGYSNVIYLPFYNYNQDLTDTYSSLPDSFNYTWDSKVNNVSTHIGEWKPQDTGEEWDYLTTCSDSFVVANGDASAGIGGIVKIGTYPNQLMVNRITKDYNTGWAYGLTQGIFLSDTDTTNAGIELIDLDTNGSTSGGSWSGATDNTIVAGSTSDSIGYYNSGFATITGKQYHVTLTISNYSGSNNMGLSTSGGFDSTFRYSANGTYSTIITGNGGAVSLFYRSSNSATVGLYMQEAEEDRSHNNDPLQVFGTITKTPVATGAELVGYSGFDASSYFRQPYNSDLDFGTGGFSVVYWFKQTTHANYQDAINRSDAGQNDGSWLIQHLNNGAVNLYIRTGGSYATRLNSGTNTITTSEWTQIVVTRKSNACTMYFNGGKVATGSSADSITLNNAQVQISGRFSTNAYPILTGNSIALVRISNSVPSAEQIKKIYEDEKFLFQENAKATLHGSSDAVTALAYDSTTSLLHVGTSGGRSTFSGLKRVENTTTAVATAISASNGLVAEQ